MNIQPTSVVLVKQPEKSDELKEEDFLALIGTGAGAMLGFLVTDGAINQTGRKVFASDTLQQPFMVKPETGILLGGIGGFFVGKGVYHTARALQDGARVVSNVKDRISNYLVETTGCTLWSQESSAVKACACLGAVWSMFAGREMMYSLIDISNPFPNSTPCGVITGISNEVINDSPLLLAGASAGYLAGKGIECVVRKVCAGVDMAGRGVASLVIPARPDAIVEPDEGKKAA